MASASPPSAEKRVWFRLHDETTETLGAPRRNLMIVIAGVLALLVLATSGKAFLANSFPRLVLFFADDPVALVSTAREEFDLTQREREFADRLPDERAGTPSPDTTKSRARRKSALSLDQIDVQAKRALMADVLDADAFDLLSRVAVAQGKPELAIRYADASVKLSLHETASTLRLAADALQTQDFARAMRVLDIQMRAFLQSTNQITPMLLQMAEQPAGLKEVVAALSSGPPWRDTFMVALPRSMTDALTPLELFRGLAATSQPASRANIAAYLDELVRRKDYQSARYAYLQLLPPDQLADLGLVSNADFDKPPFGGPFDWHIKRGGGVMAEIVSQQDRPKDRALLLQFGSGRTSFEVLQYLMLTPGSYRFEVDARGELTGRRGLIWRLTCAADRRNMGETPMFLGEAGNWVSMTAVFNVPADCPVQILTLLLDARAPSEQMASGTVWYDNVRMARVEQPAAAPPQADARPATARGAAR